MQVTQQSDLMHTSKSNLKWNGRIVVGSCMFIVFIAGFGICVYFLKFGKVGESSNTTLESIIQTENAKTISGNPNFDSSDELTQNVFSRTTSVNERSTNLVLSEKENKRGPNNSYVSIVQNPDVTLTVSSSGSDQIDNTELSQKGLLENVNDGFKEKSDSIVSNDNVTVSSSGSDQTAKTKTSQVGPLENVNVGKNSSKGDTSTNENLNTDSIPTTVEKVTPVPNFSDFLVLTADEKGILLNIFIRYLFSKKTYNILLKSISDLNPVTDTDKWHPVVVNAVKPLVNLIAFIFDKRKNGDFITVDENFDFSLNFEDQSVSKYSFHELISVNGRPKDLSENFKQWYELLKKTTLFNYALSKKEIAVLKAFLSIKDDIVEQFKTVCLSTVSSVFNILVYIMKLTLEKGTYYDFENINMLKNLWIITKSSGDKDSCLSLLNKIARFDLGLFEKIVDDSDLNEFNFNLPKVDDMLKGIDNGSLKIENLTPLEFNILARSFLETFVYETDSSDKKTLLPEEKLLPLVGLVNFCEFYLNFFSFWKVISKKDSNKMFAGYAIKNLDENKHFFIVGDVLKAKCRFKSFRRKFNRLYKDVKPEKPNKESVDNFVSFINSLINWIPVMFPDVLPNYLKGFEHNTVDLNSFKKLFETTDDKFSCIKTSIKDDFKSIAEDLVDSLIVNYKFVKENEQKESEDKVVFESVVTKFFILSINETSNYYSMYLKNILTVCMHAGIKFDNGFIDQLKTDEILPGGYKNKNKDEIEKAIFELKNISSEVS